MLQLKSDIRLRTHRWGFGVGVKKLVERLCATSQNLNSALSSPLPLPVLIQVISFMIYTYQASDIITPQNTCFIYVLIDTGLCRSTVMVSPQRRPPMFATPFLLSSGLPDKSSGYIKNLPDGAEEISNAYK